MTTAHRPTWAPAIATKDQGGNRKLVASQQFSARDLPGHTKLKYRDLGQNSVEELKARDLKAELEKKEKLAMRKRKREAMGEDFDEEEEERLLLEAAPPKRPKLLEAATEVIDFGLDADDADDSSDDSSDESDADSDDASDSEDDEEDEIQRELARIKAERAAARMKEEQEKQSAREADDEDTAMRDNPLLMDDSDFSLNKKWYDDAVFKNQSRDEPKVVKRFINDTTRNDFHKKFLNKYVK